MHLRKTVIFVVIALAAASTTATAGAKETDPGSGSSGRQISAAALSTMAAPSNDNFANAKAIAVGIEQRFDNRQATSEPGESACSLSDSIPQKTLWWKFTAPSTGQYVSYATGSDHDTSVVWNSDIATITGGCNDDANDSYDAVDTPVTLASGASQYIQIEPFADVDTGSGSVGVAKVTSPADAFASRPSMVFAPGSDIAVLGVGYTGTETVQPGEPLACGTATSMANTVWAAFTPNTTSTWMIESKATARTDIAVYSGSTLTGLSLLDCSAGTRSAVAVDLIAGQTYAIQINNRTNTQPGIIRAEQVVTRGMAQKVADIKAGFSFSSSSAVLLNGTNPAFVMSTLQLSGNLDVVFYERSTAGVWTPTLIRSGFPTTATGDVSLIVMPDGQPAVAYYDGTNKTLRFSKRDGAGTWTDVLVDSNGSGVSTDVGLFLNMTIMANGQPAIAYRDNTAQSLRVARRSPSGTWTDVLVDDNGGGAEIVARELVSFDVINGIPTIIYSATPITTGPDSMRIAKLVSGTWSDSLLTTVTKGSSDLTQSLTGTWHLVVQDKSSGHSVFGTLTGSTWTFKEVLADRDLAEYGSSTSTLQFDRDNNPVIIWADDASSDRIGVSRYDKSSGSWVEEVSVKGLSTVGDTNFTGIHAMRIRTLGSLTLPDGRLGWVEIDSQTGTTHWVEDTNRVCPTSPTPFTDVSPSSFAAHDIPCIYGLGITTGTGATTYGPSANVTRGQMASFLARTYRAITGASCSGGSTPFTDVPLSAFYANDVGCIFGLGITTGTSATTYSPDDEVTREQMASFLARLYRKITGAACSGTPTFSDVDSSSFAIGDIGCIASLGITTGTSPTTYSPDQSVSREQMAAFLARLWRTKAVFVTP